MEANYFVQNAIVQNADADFRSLLKPSALLRYVEQVSADHARKFGMTDQFFRDRGVAFLVGKQALRFSRVPMRAEKLTLTTRVESSRRGSIKRITTVTDAAGQEVAMVDCRWIVVDLATSHIMREPGWTVDGFWNESVEGELPLLLHKCKEVTPAGEGTAHYSQCDLNGHINNAFYLDVACDLLPLDIVRKGPVTFASISYHREVPLGQTMQVFYAPSAEGWYMIGKHEGLTAFECYLEFGSSAEE